MVVELNAKGLKVLTLFQVTDPDAVDPVTPPLLPQAFQFVPLKCATAIVARLLTYVPPQGLLALQYPVTFTDELPAVWFSVQ